MLRSKEIRLILESVGVRVKASLFLNQRAPCTCQPRCPYIFREIVPLIVAFIVLRYEKNAERHQTMQSVWLPYFAPGMSDAVFEIAECRQ